MTSGQIILAIAGFLIIFIIGKRFLLMRSLVHYTPSQVKEKLKSKNIILLDVRTNGERKSKKINGSLHIPLHELKLRSGELKNHNNKEIVCYCRSGNRSIKAASILNKSGYKAANMRGGIISWNY